MGFDYCLVCGVNWGCDHDADVMIGWPIDVPNE